MRCTPIYFAFSAILMLFVLASLGCAVNTTGKIIAAPDSKVIAASTPPVTLEPDSSDELWNTVRNEIDGIGIASSYHEVVRKFGKPISIKKGGTNPCGGSKSVLRYSGITFTLDKSDSLDNSGRRENIVVLIEITSPKWEIVPGVRIGYTLAEVRSRMGRLGNLSTKNGLDSLGYGDGDGSINFYFKDGRLVKIVRNLNQC